MKLVNINIRLKEIEGIASLILYKKIYSTPNGIVEHWSVENGSKIRLDVIIDEHDITVNPSKISKDMMILTSEDDIADQLSTKIVKAKIDYLQQV
jgi:hypothetical protein